MKHQSQTSCNVLLIVSEDNGPHLSCYGDQCVSTPNLDSIAAEGSLFKHAYITQSVCSPSRSSILTGLYPHQNGQIGLSTHSYEMYRNFPTIPGLLKEVGYRTGRIGKLHVEPEEAFPFDFVWNDPAYISFWHRDIEKTAEVAGDFIAKNQAEPFFLMVNYADAHLPFLRQECGEPAKPFTPGDVKVPEAIGIDTPRLREHVANYYSCIKRLDQGIGLLIEQLKQNNCFDNTLIIYLADHGPQFSRGKETVYEMAMKVPFIICWPEMGKPGMIYDSLVSSIDILPTILDVANIEHPDNLPGISLKDLITGGSNSIPREYLFCEWHTSHPYYFIPPPLPSVLYPQRAIRDGRYKLIKSLLVGKKNPTAEVYTKHMMIDSGTTQWEIDCAPPHIQTAYETWKSPPEIELYDLENDPNELNNLAGDPAYQDIEIKLLNALKKWQLETNDPLVEDKKLKQLIQEDEYEQKNVNRHTESDFKWQYLDYLYG